jgi:hypothetical protein
MRSNRNRTALSLIGLILLVVHAAGCGGVTWRDYHGPQEWATGSGFSSKTDDGLWVFEGLPDQPYQVLGVVEAQGPANAFTQPAHRKQMHQLIREHNGDAMIIIGREIIRTGSAGSYSGQAYSDGNWSHGTGTAASKTKYNYALAVLAIRLSEATSQPVTRDGRDPVEWAKSVLTGGTALLGSETGK